MAIENFSESKFETDYSDYEYEEYVLNNLKEIKSEQIKERDLKLKKLLEEIKRLYKEAEIESKEENKRQKNDEDQEDENQEDEV